MSLTAEEIEENFIKFRSLCEKLGDRSTAALTLVDGLGEHLAMCPASSKTDFHNAFPGGLVDHSLRVLGNAMKMLKAFGWNVPRDSLIISALFHDIGKVGLPNPDGTISDFYVPGDAWRRDKLGEMYAYNPKQQYMTTRERSMYVCQHYGLTLKSDEYLSILLNDGFIVDENKHYGLKIEPLVYTIMTADYIATMQEKCTGMWAEDA